MKKPLLGGIWLMELEEFINLNINKIMTFEFYQPCQGGTILATVGYKGQQFLASATSASEAIAQAYQKCLDEIKSK